MCAVFRCVCQPVSNGTPQEMAFAESMVRVVKRMSTAMLAGAPHLPANSWACADKYSVYLHDFLHSSTRGGGIAHTFYGLGELSIGSYLEFIPLDLLANILQLENQFINELL